MSPGKNVLVVGLGAVGSIYSLILKRSGLARVTTVARSNYQIVKEKGVDFKSVKYGTISGWKPDRLVGSVEEAANCQYDYVLVTTKAVPELVRTHTLLKAFLGAPYVDKFVQPTYVLMQNGLNVEDDLYRAVNRLGQGEPEIIGSAVWIGTNMVGSNQVQHNDFDRVSLGVYRPGDYTTAENSPSESALLSDFGKMLESGGTTLSIVPEIQRVKFQKNFWNVAFSSCATLTGYTLPALFRPPPPGDGPSYEPYLEPKTAEKIREQTIPTLLAILHELVALGRAMGFPDSEDGVPSSAPERLMENVRQLHVRPESSHRPSMLLDAENGKPIEVEAILGEVVRMAKARGVAIPRIETLYALLLIKQNQILRKLST